jgi:hypothetical protein
VGEGVKKGKTKRGAVEIMGARVVVEICVLLHCRMCSGEIGAAMEEK